MNNEEVISHHGILGMRWGVRRYQNSDGSLTDAGRRRAQKLKGEYKTLTGKKLKGKIPKEEPHKRKITELNATELKTRYDRAKKMKETLDNEADSYTSFKKTLFRRVVAPAAIEAGKDVLKGLIKTNLEKALGLNSDKIKNVSKESKKEIDKVSDQIRKDLAKDEQKRAERAAKKEAEARERQIDKAIDAWERQQQANRDFAREMAANKPPSNNHTNRGKTVVKEAILNDYYLPYYDKK